MKNSSISTILPSALAEISADRDHLNTSEFARAIDRASQTIRAKLCSDERCEMYAAPESDNETGQGLEVDTTNDLPGNYSYPQRGTQSKAAMQMTA